MMTLRQLSLVPKTVPASTGWYLADLGESRGKQELFTKQSPQRLKALREHALIESAISSNRIEGVEVDRKRIGTVVFGRQILRDRDEEEVRGYRKALDLIHSFGRELPITEATLLQLHTLTRGDLWDAGKYKEKSSNIIEKYPNGKERIRFVTVSPEKTPAAVQEVCSLWAEGLRERWCHPLILLAAANLDFLCIHPFRDGNGRVSRLLLLLQCYHLGFEVGRYISIERLIEQNKDRYYETLETSSHQWHEGKHDPWPYINFILYIVKSAYREFEERVGQTKTPRGTKSEIVLDAIARIEGTFSVGDIQRLCPGVGIDMIRKILKDQRSKKRVQCLGRGPTAQWKRVRK
jgi:Fic family protein